MTGLIVEIQQRRRIFVPLGRVNAYSTRKRVEKARPSRWKAKA